MFSRAAECGSPTATEDCSPVPQARRAKLLPLRYYEIDPSYNVPAALTSSEDRPVFEMPTSTGMLRRMERVGVLELSLNGQPMTLAAFVEEGTRRIETLFVRSPIRRRARRHTRPDVTWTCIRPPPASMRSTSTRPTTRTVRLQRHLRVSVPAAVEPSEAGGSRG